MPFELESNTKVRVLDVRTLAAKDRKPDEPPGAQMLMQATLPVDVLAMFDGFLPGMLYRKSEGSKQGKLDGMEGSELTSIGEHVKRLPWQYEQTGCIVEIDRGLGGKRNIVLDDCKVHRMLLSPQQGGAVKAQWTIDAPALSDDVRGKLTGLKSTEIEMLLLLPTVAQQEIEPPKPKRTKAIDGTVGHPALAPGPGESDSEGGDPDISDQPSEATGDDRANWPFPGDSRPLDEVAPQSVRVEGTKRTKRGRDATAAYIAAQQGAAE
jgi:hypothetical protein